MTATAVLDPPGAAMSTRAATHPAPVEIPCEDLPALLDQAEVPEPLRKRISARIAIGDLTWSAGTARIAVGDLTWSAGSDGLVVWVPPSQATTARTSKPVKVYRVEETGCTCRGFYTKGGCYHPWLWAVIHAFLHPPAFTVTGDAALTLEQPLLLAALDLVQQHAVGELTLWLGSELLVLDWMSPAGTAGQLSLLGQGASANEATARGPVAALRALIASCPPEEPVATLVAAPTGLTWSMEVPA